MSSLLDAEKRADFIDDVKETYAEMREEHYASLQALPAPLQRCTHACARNGVCGLSASHGPLPTDTANSTIVCARSPMVLHGTALQCSALQCAALHCSAVRCTALRYT